MITKQRLFVLLFYLFTVLPFSFAAIIKGVVIDKVTQEPLVGATVQILSSSAATITNMDGQFELNTDKKGSVSIEVRYLGYRSERLDGINVQSKDLIEFKLEQDEHLLDEVSVDRKSVV